MSDKKNIDKLFQEKLKDFEATPSPVVWDKISAGMGQEKKRRRVIPLWLRIGGIAAGIILLISLGNAFLNQDNKGNDIPTPVVEIDKDVDDTNKNEDPIESNSNENREGQVELVGQSDDLSSESPEDVSNPDSNNPSNRKTIQNNESTVAEGNSEGIKNRLKVEDENQLMRKNKAVVENKENDKNSDLANSQNNPNKANNDSENLNQPIQKEEADKLIDKSINEADSKLAENSDQENSDETKTPSDNTDEEAKEDEKASLLDALAENDSETEKDEDENRKRWSVSPNVAPVYFNSMGSGSAIDEKFTNNSRTGEINMNYGLGASYAFNDKLKIRTGINRMNLSYRTNDIIVYNNVEPNDGIKPLKNVNLNESSKDLSFLSANGLIFAQVPGVVANTIESSIDQELAFLEIPVELEYTISDKKLDINLIGGFSTLILSENKIYSSLQGERTLLGEASNINNTSFTANLGVGFNYEVSEKIDLNLEPVLKYQLNTFNDTNGNFNPYTVGVYTGFRFKF